MPFIILIFLITYYSAHDLFWNDPLECDFIHIEIKPNKNTYAKLMARETAPTTFWWSFLIRVNHNYGVDILTRATGNSLIIISVWALVLHRIRFSYHFCFLCEKRGWDLVEKFIVCFGEYKKYVEHCRRRESEWIYLCVCVTLCIHKITGRKERMLSCLCEQLITTLFRKS